VPDQLLPYLVVAAVITVTPGPDMALALRNGAVAGPRGTWWTGVGFCTGLAAHAAAAVVGLSALLVASEGAFTVVKLAGAAYLAYLGATALWHSFTAKAEVGEDASHESSPVALSRVNAFRQGVFSNLLNPKIALMFLTLLPQFVSDGEPKATTTAVLAGIFVVWGVVWWGVFSLAVGALGRFLSRPRVRLVFERATGVVLLALGLRIVVEAVL
jgi:threonine/homoserine/homoserine lactone efflux protein